MYVLVHSFFSGTLLLFEIEAMIYYVYFGAIP